MAERKVNKVLVTGATGMLGTRLVFDLLREGQKVRAIYRNEKRIDQFKKNIAYYCQNPEELSSLVEWVKSDVLDYESMCQVVEGMDLVYHSAAMVSFHSADQEDMFEINIQGTANVVNACLLKNVPKICHVSSIAALGKEDEGVEITEDSSWIPHAKHSGYQISKFHSEMEVWRGVNEGMEAVVVNPSVILGPGEWHAGSPAFFNNVFEGMTFYPGGGTGFVDVNDVSKAMVLLTNESNWEKANKNKYLLNGENLSYQYVFTKIAQTLDVKPPKLLAKPWLLGIAWRAAKLVGKITGKKPLITKGSVANASKMQFYSGKKITDQFSFKYTTIDETIERVGQVYLKDHS